ncbi:hypothetical protein DFJ74DRAFT_474761 [Hyaloraphidium curvatum]|nr:hypothetical protein DFJ74DRAFT_474761 [Hyaloraphidium curvatum]
MGSDLSAPLSDSSGCSGMSSASKGEARAARRRAPWSKAAGPMPGWLWPSIGAWTPPKRAWAVLCSGRNSRIGRIPRTASEPRETAEGSAVVRPPSPGLFMQGKIDNRALRPPLCGFWRHTALRSTNPRGPCDGMELENFSLSSSSSSSTLARRIASAPRPRLAAASSRLSAAEEDVALHLRGRRRPPVHLSVQQPRRSRPRRDAPGRRAPALARPVPQLLRLLGPAGLLRLRGGAAEVGGRRGQARRPRGIRRVPAREVRPRVGEGHVCFASHRGGARPGAGRRRRSRCRARGPERHPCRHRGQAGPPPLLPAPVGHPPAVLAPQCSVDFASDRCYLL